ncbi:MAG: hypothetical protein N4A74_17865, partial [Carboxylicivirga sp.]|nr:hypothetical protein [Carboxylicivirga sp.]
GYSIYDIIERLTKSKPNQSIQTPTTETESELSKSQTLTLDQKNLDSSHNSKTPLDSSKNN